jgi:hypothetical protein
VLPESEVLLEALSSFSAAQDVRVNETFGPSHRVCTLGYLPSMFYDIRIEFRKAGQSAIPPVKAKNMAPQSALRRQYQR